MGILLTAESQGVGLGRVRRSKRREEEASVSPLPLLPWRECVSSRRGSTDLGVVVTLWQTTTGDPARREGVTPRLGLRRDWGPWSFCKDVQAAVEPTPTLRALSDKSWCSELQVEFAVPEPLHSFCTLLLPDHPSFLCPELSPGDFLSPHLPSRGPAENSNYLQKLCPRAWYQSVSWHIALLWPLSLENSASCPKSTGTAPAPGSLPMPTSARVWATWANHRVCHRPPWGLRASHQGQNLTWGDLWVTRGRNWPHAVIYSCIRGLVYHY